MREVLLATALLSSMVASEDFEVEKRYPTSSDVDPNFWPVRGRRSSWERDFGTSLVDVKKNYLRDTALPQFSFQNSHQFPAFARYPTSLGSWADNQVAEPRISDYRKSPTCGWSSPALPYDYYKLYDHLVVCERLQCGPKSGHRGTLRWRRQPPLYVEEPNWIDISPKYDSGYSSEQDDPFFVTRGKKRRDPFTSSFTKTSGLTNMVSQYDPDPFFISRGKRHAKTQEYRMKLKEEEYSTPTSSKINEGQLSLSSAVGRTGQTYSVKFVPKTEEAPEYKEPEAIKNDPINRFSFTTMDDRERNVVGDKNHTRSNISTNSEGPFFVPRDNAREKRNTDDQASIASRGNSKGWKPDVNRQRSKRGQQMIFTDKIQDQNAKWRDSEEEDAVSREEDYMHPRSKYSNILEILDEPFFISRGKKSNPESHNEVRNVEALEIRIPGIKDQLIDVLSDLPYVLRGIERSRNILGGVKSRARLENKKYHNGDDLEFLQNFRQYGIDRDKKMTPRSRRGRLDDLLSRNGDPFYVARGKRHSNEKPTWISHQNFLT